MSLKYNRNIILSLLFYISNFGLLFAQNNSFDGSKNDFNLLCGLIQSNSFANDQIAEQALDKIIKSVDIPQNFIIGYCPDIENCVAVTYRGVRYIIYDREFMRDIAKGNDENVNLSILAHEIGHHVYGHTVDIELYENNSIPPPSLRKKRMQELEADEFSGFVMARLGKSLNEALFAVNQLPRNSNDVNSTHPSRDKRISAVKKGYNRGKKSNNTITNNTVISPEEYYLKGLKMGYAGSWSSSIDFFNKAIRLNPDFFEAYNARGTAYEKTGYIKKAMQDYSKAYTIEPKYRLVCYNIGFTYLWHYKSYSSAIIWLERYLQMKNNIDDEWELEAYLELASAYQLSGDLEKALEISKLGENITTKNAFTRFMIFNNRTSIYNQILSSGRYYGEEWLDIYAEAENNVEIANAKYTPRPGKNSLLSYMYKHDLMKIHPKVNRMKWKIKFGMKLDNIYIKIFKP